MSQNIRLNRTDTFEPAWARSSKTTLNDISKFVFAPKSIQAPYPILKEYKLDKSVVTCYEAARAKGIPLDQELKTLLLDTSLGYVALELPGDATASLRKIKDALEVKQAHLASPETLLELHLEPGTVSTVRPPVWDMPHLISRRVLCQEFLSTNSGHKKGFYRFPPSLLLEAQAVIIGDFEDV